MILKRPILLLGLFFALLSHGCQQAGAQGRAEYRYRWVYAPHNMLDDKAVERLLQLMERAHQSGYNGMVLADDKLQRLDLVPPHYFENVARVRKFAREAQLEIIPMLFPMGYSGPLLGHDPNLAEGVPVVGAPFVVVGREAKLAPEPSARIANGGLEEAKEHLFSSFMIQDEPGKVTFADRQVVHGGKVSLRIQASDGSNPNAHHRIAQRVKVRPHAAYRFSAWVKTRDLAPVRGFQLLVRETGWRPKQLSFYEARLKPTQDWTQVDVVFNSLDADEVHLYAGHWGGQSGTFWIDDLALEELPLVNVLRREGCPFSVTSDDGKTVYEEGKDFHPVQDPKLGQEPWAGEYNFSHPGPPLRLTEASRIKEGQRLRVSWYHPLIFQGFQVMACLTEAKVYQLLRDQAKRLHELLKPETFFMQHDEIRLANWCRTCQGRKVSPGELLANNVSQCIQIIREVNPSARIVVWSDMFDPNHNAVDDYYLVHGSWKGSWKGLTPEVTIANWNFDRRADSLKWFAQRGHRQVVAGYYDTDLDNFKKWDAAVRGIPNVEGFMYTTWDTKYDMLEAYGKALRGENP